MSRRSSGRSVFALIVEIALIALVVAILPKLDLRPKSADPAATTWQSPPAAAPIQPPSRPWWEAAPAARETSWQAPIEVNVEQTLDRASRQLLSGVGDYAARAGADLFQPPPLPPMPSATPASPPPLHAQPRDWPRY
jgi:hypothetical protein